ncbi:MAG: MBL fold metallo-hydrolase [Candidatus Bathyarchaeota archaeon]|nr:MBL fold metallo-hydrolase [Candidatus Bathyarchaeota archaeon]MDH5733622.1 MBL fold metallo-hydrolase [Candidatus Bathyarchaeota archaeon]
MFIKMFTVGMISTNCYLVGCTETKEALVIDPGFGTKVEAEEILGEAKKHGSKIKYIVNTHGHPDHTSGNKILKELTGAEILIHEYDASKLANTSGNLLTLFGLHSTSPPADKILHEGDIIQVGTIKLKVLHTPGHSRGGISLLGEDIVFTGDTLFAGSIGRYDFPDASYKELMRSIRDRLATLPDHMKVYSGHGPPTTIGKEKRYNPFLQNFV